MKPKIIGLLLFVLILLMEAYLINHLQNLDKRQSQQLAEAAAKEWPLPQPDTTLTFSRDGHVKTHKIPSGENIEVITDKEGYLLDVRIISTTLQNGDLGGVDPKAYSKGVIVSE